MKKTPEILWCDCRTCGRKNRFEILAEHIAKGGGDEYHYQEAWQVARCMGCTTVCFRKQFDDLENVWQDYDGQWQHDISIDLYPRAISGHRALHGLRYLPRLIRNIYEQSLTAFKEDALILSGVGFRATIEAACNELGIPGSSLEKRIDNLQKAGFVSNKDKKRLHAIRFLGNDAAHDIKAPSSEDLRIVLEIVEGLLNSVFILEKMARGLETTAETFEEFEAILGQCARRHKEGDVMSLGAIIGDKRRLIGNNLAAFEAELGVRLSAGKPEYLQLDQQRTVDGHPVQLYKLINVDKIPEVQALDDEILF